MVGIAGWSACTEICDEPPVDDLNALYLELKTEGDGSFTEEERDGFYLVRYLIVPGDSLTYPEDTVFYYGNFHDGSNNKIRLSNGTPFVNDSLFYVRYNYGMFTDADSTFQKVITDIDLKGAYLGECEYENQVKTFRLNDQLVDRSGNTDYYEITK